MEKKCTQCKKTKDIKEFPKRLNRQGLKKLHYPYCRNCIVVRVKEWQKKNKEKYRLYQNKYHKDHARL